MKLFFCRSNTISSWLIRLFTWSPWSHVAVVENDEFVIDATFKHGGVRRRALREVLAASSAFELVEIELPEESAALTFLRAQIGKPYDWTAILGFIGRSHWEEDDAWFCNELAEAAMVAGGRRRFRESLWRLTPRNSWMVL